MGFGAYRDQDVRDAAARKAAAGYDQFDYDDRFRRGEVHGIADCLDPLGTNKNGPHTGQNIREAMVSEEHPNPTAIAVIFDETGSMGEIPRILQTKLSLLNGLLKESAGVPDPMILFGGCGDANSDEFPLQIGQFESDSRMDDQLTSIILEGNGGGQGMETYDMAAYYMARHTYLETLDRTGKKGYLFTIGDERPYGEIRPRWGRHTITQLTGDDIITPIPLARIADEVTAKYNWFHLVVRSRMYRPEHSMPTWQRLLGERAILLPDPEKVAEAIALIVGTMEGNLDASGLDQDVVQAASRALLTA